jgi:hypothetical protein
MFMACRVDIRGHWVKCPGIAVLAAVWAFLGGSPAIPLAASAKQSSGDVAALKKLLATAAAWSAGGKSQIDSEIKHQLAGIVATLGDAALRERAKRMLPELERALVLHRRVLPFLKDIQAVKGTAKTEPGGPAWLRDLVGAESMGIFDRLTVLDIYDPKIPIKSGRMNDQVTDKWLERIAGLPDVRSLNLQSAAIQGPGLRYVGTLKSLDTLNLTLTPISDPPLVQLKGLTNLRSLYLASTKVKGEGLRHLKLTRLENLNLHSAPVNDAGLEQIGLLTSLERLEIVHTHFTDKGAVHLRNLTRLRRLQLGSPEGTGASLAHLRGLTSLHELDLHDGQTSPDGAKHVGGLKSLRILRVYGGAYQDDDVMEIAKLASLESLVLHTPRLTDTGLQHLSSLKRLRRLEVMGTKVSAAGVARLKEALPRLEVVR